MSSYCLKCKKNTGNINTRVSKISNGKTITNGYYQKVLYVVAKNQDLLTNKKEVEYYVV